MFGKSNLKLVVLLGVGVFIGGIMSAVFGPSVTRLLSRVAPAA